MISPIKMTDDALIITIPHEILFSVWTLDKNINKSIVEIIPIALRHIDEINEKIRMKNE